MSHKKNLIISVTLAVFSLAGLTVACTKSVSLSQVFEAWNLRNSPSRVQFDFNHDFNQLPLAGKITKMPWSDTYWPSNEGGVAARWADPHAPDAFSYESPTLEEYENMSVNDRKMLSPAEKYDIFMGRFDYPTVQFERKRTKPTNESWEGICHGWANAAINFDEPKPLAVAGVNGITVEFGSSDVKALLSYYQGQVAPLPALSRSLGATCLQNLELNPEAANSPACKDTNPGAFHIALTNFIALRNRGFVVDVTRDAQVWNQPVYGYSSTIESVRAPSEKASPGTFKELIISTQMNYTFEIEPNWDVVLDTREQSTKSKLYQYSLELNAAGDIIGGEWISDDRPDFLWFAEKPKFSDYYANLENIYNQAIK